MENTPTLKPGQMYCKICKQVFLKRNFNRHDISNKHEEAVNEYAAAILAKNNLYGTHYNTQPSTKWKK